MKINRVWAMPNKWTFKIKPVRELLDKYVDRDKEWIDPMAGFNSPAKITNDLNPDAPTKFHKDALEFLKEFPDRSADGIIFDPPYSYEKAKRLYKYKYPDTQVFFNYITGCKNEIKRIVKPGGYVIMCGWNSNGIGKKHGFEMKEILLIAHGWQKGDTIVTVERKTQTDLPLGELVKERAESHRRKGVSVAAPVATHGYEYRCYNCGHMFGECIWPPIRCPSCGKDTVAIYENEKVKK